MGNRLTVGPPRKEVQEQLEQEALARAFDSDAPPGSLDLITQFGQLEVEKEQARLDAEEQKRKEENARADAEFARAQQVVSQQRQAQRKIEEIQDGSTEPIPETNPETGNTIDLNPNNQSRTEEDRDDLFLRAFEANKQNAADLRTLLAEDKEREVAQIKEMKDRIKALQNRDTGIDLSPLAALIDDPNKARLLQQALSPEFSELEKENQIADLQDKLDERQDNFKRSRRLAEFEINRIERQADSDIIRSQIAEANRRTVSAERRSAEDRRRQDKLNDFRERKEFEQVGRLRSVLKPQRETLENIGGIVDQLTNPRNVERLPDGRIKLNSALVGSLVRAKVARAANGPGILTDKDFDRFSGSLSTLERIERFTEQEIKSGVTISERDLEEIISLTGATFDGVSKRVEEQLDAQAGDFQNILGERHGVKAEDYRKKGGLLETDRYVSPSTRANVKKLTGASDSRRSVKEKVGGMSTEEKRRRLQELEALE